jgi:hypothetical protein
MAILRFFCDESWAGEQKVKVKTFTVAGFIAKDSEWGRLSSQWSKRIEKEGISRFHAAPLNGKKGEFAGWSNERSKNFTVSLLRAIGRRKLFAASFSIFLDPYEKMSDKDKAILGTPYLLCFKHLVEAVAGILTLLPDEDTIAFIFDDNDERDQIVSVFNLLKETKYYGHRLATCTPGSWKDYVELQPADLLAYETFKFLSNGGKRENLRRALENVIKNVEIYGAMFEEPAFIEMAQILANGRGEDFEYDGKSII